MNEELLQQVAALLAGGFEGDADDLDSLENQLIPALRRAGQLALQRKLEGKKRGTRAAGSPANAAKKPVS